MAKRGLPRKDKEEKKPWTAPPTQPPAFVPVTMQYRDSEKVVTTQAHLDHELARGKWSVKK